MLLLLLFVPLLALESDWVVGHSSVVQRGIMGAGIGLVGVGMAGRVRVDKLGLGGQRGGTVRLESERR